MAAKRDRWLKDFSKWFHDVIRKAGLVDYRYPIKGCGVWLPYGFKLRKNVLDVVRNLLDASGHEEVLFPVMITSEMIRKEATHIESFEEQVFWITHAGKRRLEEELALRPTSETAIAPMLKAWIRSHADLPKKLYQVVSIFRYETKATRPLIRVREVTTFKEAHTSHENQLEAEKQFREAVNIYSRFFDELSLAYLISKRPDWDKFAGALYSVAHDTILPDGRALQIGTTHNLGQNFAKAFDITFEKEDGSREHVWQTCYGISERVIAAVVAVHGDDRGLVLPPAAAPTQVVVVPIPYRGFEEKVTEKCMKVADALRLEGIRVEVDLREKLTPGSKFYEWELKGVPVRIEIGPKDVEMGTLTFFRRDTLDRVQVEDAEILRETRRLFSEIKQNLKKRALEWLESHIYTADSLPNVEEASRKKSGVIETGWCGEEKCGLTLENQTNMKVLGTPYEGKEPEGKKCPVCGGKAKFLVRLARPY